MEQSLSAPGRTTSGSEINMLPADKSPKVTIVGGEPVDLKRCHVCCNLGAEGCPMGLSLKQQVEGTKPTPFKKCTAFKE